MIIFAITVIVLFCIWIAAITDRRERIEFALDAAAWFEKYDVIYAEMPRVYFMMTEGPRLQPGGGNYPYHYNVIHIKNNRTSRWWAKFVIFCNNY